MSTNLHIFLSLFTAIQFDVPVAVQPMHTITAVALVEGFSQEEVAASGICMALAVLFLGITQLINVLNKVIPLSVVRGIQLGQKIF